MDFDYYEEYLRIISNKMLLWQKNKFILIWHLKIDKKEAIPEKIQAGAGWGMKLKTYFFDENPWNF